MKNIANVVTLSRIPFAIGMVSVTPLGLAFWVFYLCGGLTDLLDGFIARKLNLQSVTGAKLDSVADMFFAMAIIIVVVKNFRLPLWIWVCIFLIAVLRISSYIIGFYKFRTFSSLHTYANKATGALIFAFPLFYSICDSTIVEVITCIVAFVSSLEELAITIKSRELDPNCKTIFSRK